MKNTFVNQFESWFFSEDYSIRLLRVAAMLVVIFSSISIGLLLPEPFDTSKEFWFQILRYIVAPLAAMISALLLGAQFVQDIYELESYGTALKYLLVNLFEGPPLRYILPSGLLLPSLTISEGKRKINELKENLIEKIGGPGWLYVEPGNVAVLERLDRKSLVLGGGLHYVSRFEHIKDVISLEDQRWDASDIRAVTRDGFLVTINGFQFGYRLASDQTGNGHTKRSLSDPYPFSIQAVQTYSYERSVTQNGKPTEWGRAVQLKLDGAITDFINKSFLDQLTAPLIANNDPRSDINKAITDSQMQVSLRNMTGAELLWHNIGNFDIEPLDSKPEEDPDNDSKQEIRRSIKDQRLKSWLAQWTGTAAVIRARGVAEKLSQEESGRAETTAVMLQSIMNALNDSGVADVSGDAAETRLDENLWNIVLARTAQIIESLTSFYGERLDMPDINLGRKSEK